MIYNDDCLNVLRKLSNNTVDLIYLDPPFFTQKQQKLSNSTGKTYTFSDVWTSRKDYLDYLEIRLIEMHRVLKNTGSIFLHCDTDASHYLRLLLDEIFGEECFRSEIIWTYKRWSNSQKGLLPNHQTIFFYSKTSDFKFNTLYGQYSPTTNIDQLLQERERNSIGKTVYKRDENGDVITSKEKKGVPLSDVWDIPFLNPRAKERVGYPTQKPIELLERIINIASDKGDLILDPFCGSGTTLVSAKLLERDYIGIDINPDAVALTNERLQNPFKTNSNLLKVGTEAYETKTDEELAIIKQFDCDIVQRNKGIDALLKKQYENKPVALKIQKDNETLEEAIQLLYSASQKKSCSYSILITIDTDYSHQNIPTNMVLIPRYQSRFWEFVNQTKLGDAQGYLF